jgi:glycerophosphoryl diester phosphodiesterase
MINGRCDQLALVGHRGTRDLETENTLEAFRLAEEAGLPWLELDVHLSADGAAVVHHDDTLDRLAAGEAGKGLGPIAQLSLAQIQAVEIGRGQRVPTLVEVLDATTAHIQIEIKAVDAADEVARILAERPNDAARVRIISFYPDALRRVQQTAPAIPRGLLISGYGEGVEALLGELAATALYPRWNGMTDEVIERIQGLGYQIGVWTVASVGEVRRALRAGLVSITVDDPRAAVEWLAQAQSERASA